MSTKYKQSQIDLLNEARMLLEQYVNWTRYFIISATENLNDIDETTKRLLKNSDNFSDLLRPYYGDKITDQFIDLFKQHLLTTIDFVNAIKDNNDAVDEIRKKWYAGTDEISTFLARINPYWDETIWKNLFYRHLQLTEHQVVLRLEGKYEDEIVIHDIIEETILMMADYMFYGIVNQLSIG